MSAALDRIPVEPVGDGTTPKRVRGLVEADEIIKRGWLCMLDSDGMVVEATKTTSQFSGGIALQDVDATGATDGAKMIELLTGVVRIRMGASADAVAQSDLGAVLYALDNQTVTTVSTGASPCGIMWSMDEESTAHVHMLVGPLARALATAIAS